MRRVTERSILPWLELDISDDNIPRACEQIADWLESTGRLYADY